jgi:hypothetical protein
LGLPELIRREVETRFKRDVLELISELKGGHSRLFDIVRNLGELVLPDEAEVDKIVSQIFDNVGVEILPVPFSFTSAKASFQKIINEVAPSETKEQFKDGVIWADCLELLKTDDIFLITKDKAFYKDRDYKQGLAPSLAAELSEGHFMSRVIGLCFILTAALMPVLSQPTLSRVKPWPSAGVLHAISSRRFNSRVQPKHHRSRLLRTNQISTRGCSPIFSSRRIRACRI